MRSVWFASFALAVFSFAGVAHARADGASPGAYLSVREARQHVPPAPKDCPGASAPEACTAVFIPEDGRAGLQWRPVWMSRDQVVCRDELTADFRVACTDPDAVPSVDPRLRACSRGRDGKSVDCREMPSNLRERARSMQEALRHPPRVPWDCIDRTNANACALVVEAAERDWWTTAWAPREKVICVDRTGSVKRVACDAPGAWPTRNELDLSDEYATPQAALGHMEAVPARCRDAAGSNVCVPSVIFFERTPGPSTVWMSRWSAPNEIVCYPGYTVEAFDEAPVACEAPGAARSFRGPPPRLEAVKVGS
ncbi:hypothetical protein [Caulobacter sp. 17J65-9]|uniref:hypothetical protein n=1 Tax=Caulobacter sp. 17J65-9 TaxID=2709382 RepID=UPI0013CC224F|nr:hypothetical protein [Caulobacter sp. 17J65-9]NEX92945.1 hypothetical protein [Caulobacter sp. 17J65-9]